MRCLAVLALLLGGCDLYFGGDDEPPCAYGTSGGGAVGAVPPEAGYRNPYSGQCEYYGGGYYPCDDSCGPCPQYDVASPPYDWAMCYSSCEALGEDQCNGTSGCYSAYLGEPNAYKFMGCFATAPSGPIQGGNCTGLDAYSCSRHDDCSALYSPTGGQHFTQCMPEQSTCNCGPGYHCEEQCDANAMCGQVCVSNLTCASVDCAPGYTCAQVCNNGKCGPTCVGNPTACSTLTSESSCVSRADCTPVYEGTDCTCYPTHCSCETLTYERCEAL